MLTVLAILTTPQAAPTPADLTTMAAPDDGICPEAVPGITDPARRARNATATALRFVHQIAAAG